MRRSALIMITVLALILVLIAGAIAWLAWETHGLRLTICELIDRLAPYGPGNRGQPRVM